MNTPERKSIDRGVWIGIFPVVIGGAMLSSAAAPVFYSGVALAMIGTVAFFAGMSGVLSPRRA